MQRLGWRDDQPDHVYANLVLKLNSSNCVCLFFCVDFSNVLRVLISIDAQHLLAGEMTNHTTFMPTWY